MRCALAPPLGLALASAVALASSDVEADPPRVSLRLEYARAPGAETCPAEPVALRAEIARRMGYDPFDPAEAVGPERLAVTLSRQGRGFAARIERYGAGGELTWSETFAGKGDTCASLMSPLATELRALMLTFQGPPVGQAASPPPAPAPAPAPPPAPVVVAPLAPTVQPANLPEPPNVPNPARGTANRVAIVAYALSGTFLALGIAWAVDAENKGSAARALAAQQHASGTAVCAQAGAPSVYCASLLEAVRGQDLAIGLRNVWFAAAGVSAAAGVVATFWGLSLPATIKGLPQTQVTLRPGGLIIHGSF